MVEVERVEVGVSVFVVNAGLVCVSGLGEVGMRGVCFACCGASGRVVEVRLSRGSRAWSLVSVEVRREPAVCVLPAELFAWRDMLDVIRFNNPFRSFSRSGRPWIPRPGAFETMQVGVMGRTKPMGTPAPPVLLPMFDKLR